MIEWIVLLALLMFGPFLAIGTIRKIKARFQNRVGASVLQPMFDVIKLLGKGETLSTVASWMLRTSSVVNLAIILIIAVLTPWFSFKPSITGCDLILVIYLFAFMRLMTVLAALDAGSAFGGFAGSREVMLAVLVEPAIMLSLAALAVASHSSDLTLIFSYSNSALMQQPVLWVVCAIALFLAAVVELSRMPIDDPTTHLELTMVHEAMVLENSGRNLALVDYAHGLKLLVLFGLAGQCLLHAFGFAWHLSEPLRALASLGFLVLPLILIALIESSAVKLRWTTGPAFIAYSVGAALVAVLIVVGGSQWL